MGKQNTGSNKNIDLYNDKPIYEQKYQQTEEEIISTTSGRLRNNKNSFCNVEALKWPVESTA